jgi:hypothetical protein
LKKKKKESLLFIQMRINLSIFMSFSWRDFQTIIFLISSLLNTTTTTTATTTTATATMMRQVFLVTSKRAKFKTSINLCKACTTNFENGNLLRLSLSYTSIIANQTIGLIHAQIKLCIMDLDNLNLINLCNDTLFSGSRLS